jgi:uncharacterized delta-60 repeat protein
LRTRIREKIYEGDSMLQKIVLPAILLILLNGVSFAAPGGLDPTFSGDGVARYSGSGENLGHAVAVQADGKIVVAGEAWTDSGWSVLVLRYNLDGTLDKTFSGDGIARHNSGHWNFVHGVDIQADGRIVVVGEIYYPNYDASELLVLRFNTNGTLDSTFGESGIVRYGYGGIAYGVAIQSDQKIVVVGDSSYSVLVLRYDSSGNLDPEFGAGGVFEYDTSYFDYARGVAIQDDGKIVISGGDYTLLVLRLNSNGTLDNTFSGDGAAFYDGASGYGVGIQSDGKIVIAGGASVVRYNSDGTLDDTFGGGGIATYDGTVSAVAIQSDGKIVVAGFKNRVALVLRFTTQGSLDSTFSSDGAFKFSTSGSTWADAVAATLDGKIICVGANNYMIGPFVHNDVITLRIIAIAPVIVSPNGGEVIPAGEPYHITWEAPAKATKFKLQYSTNNGTTWQMAAPGLLTGTAYDWSVPVPSNNKRKCLLKLVGFDDNLVKIGSDKTDAPFTIEVLRLTYPNGGETFTSGNQLFITWTTNPNVPPVDHVVLSYTLNNGLTWERIDATADPSDDGSFFWTVPGVIKVKPNCKVKIVLKDAAGKILGSDSSDKIFRINPAL